LVSSQALLAAMPFSPVIDNYLFHRQPYAMLMDGDYDQSIQIISGTVEHETEIFIRAIWGAPISGLMYKAAMTLLLLDREKAAAVLAKYPPLCEQDQSTPNQNTFGWTQEECEEKLCGIDLLSGICKNPLNPVPQVCKSLLEGCGGSSAENDDRVTVEEPGTEWIFTCPELNWFKSHTGGNAYKYHFRAPIPIDISKIGQQGQRMDGWLSYERCEYLSCHAADLSYTFELEKQFNCTAFVEAFPNMATCTAEGELVEEPLLEMERYYHRYWGNFARTGNPNDETGAVYPAELSEIYEKEPLPEWPQITDDENGATMHFGYNTEDTDDTDCAISKSNRADTQCIIRLQKDFKKAECEFWDGLDVYPST